MESSSVRFLLGNVLKISKISVHERIFSPNLKKRYYLSHSSLLSIDNKNKNDNRNKNEIRANQNGQAYL